jgi:hypothetical protein
MSNWDTDTQYTEHRIAKVEPGDEGWSLYFEGSTGMYCPSDTCQQAPAAGETARLYGRGLGYEVRGLIIEGRVYFYRTEEQQEDHHAAWVEGQKKARADQLAAERADRDARRAALPEAFQARLNEYERRNPNWRRDYESYELSVCEDAARIARHFGADLEGLRRFGSLSWDEQNALVPGLFDGHSGNSWGAALELAGRFARDPKFVRGAHGALCPLVGCTEYGCPGADVKEASDGNAG